ncbi:MAG: LON peptidase substrate-binding domain-containing protein [Candidatus Eremiobacteraeota bacterium]|nr:LON peptidase substrate-binding domain-containing protein [Candidatus Eremiobacteraeota bacterium]
MSARLRLFPLNAVLFPGATLNLHVFEPRYKQMIGECMQNGDAFGVVLIQEGEEAGDPSVTPHQIGSTAEIVEVTQLPFDRYFISTIGRERFRIREIVSREPYLTVEADYIAEDEVDEGELSALVDEVRTLFLEYLDLIIEFTGQQSEADLPDDAQSFSFIIADALQIGDALKQRLLEVESTKQRLTVEGSFLRRLIPQLKKLVERRQRELEARGEDPEAVEARKHQEEFFGRYFSAN